MLLRQTILYLPAQVFGPLAQVVAAIVWTHWLAPAPYGLLTFLVASQDLVFLVCLSWWTQFTLRYYAGLNGAERESFVASEVSILAFSVPVQIVATLLVLAFLREPISGGLALGAVAYIGTRSLLNHLAERARAQSRIGVYTVGQFAGSVLGFAVAYGAVALISATAEAVLFGFAVAQLLGAAVMWRTLGLRLGQMLPRRDILNAALAYGAPLVVAGAAAWIAQNNIRLVVEQVAGADALGLIAVGWALGQRLAATLAMLVIAASFPLAVKNLHVGSRADAYRQLSLGGILLMGLIVPASIGLCLLAEPFVTLFVAAPFRAITIAVLPYAAAAGAVRNIRIHIADPVFLLIERPRINTAINAIDAACALVCCLLGYYAGGLVGAVAGCLVGTILSFVAGFVLAQRFGEYRFPYGDGVKIVLASTAMAVLLAMVPWAALGWAPLVRMAAEATGGALIYVAAIVLLYPGIAQETWRRIGAAYRVGIGVPLR